MSDVRQRLAEIQSGIVGVRRAYVWAPQSLADTDLPAFCTFAGPATVNSTSETFVEETRTWLMRLYIKPVLQGIDGEAEKAVEPFLERVRDAFLSHPLLGKNIRDSVLPWIRKTAWLGDSGIQVLSYAGQNYLGSEFRLNVTKIVPISIALYE